MRTMDCWNVSFLFVWIMTFVLSFVTTNGLSMPNTNTNRSQIQQRHEFVSSFLTTGGIIASTRPAWADIEGVVTPILDDDDDSNKKLTESKGSMDGSKSSSNGGNDDGGGVTLYTTKSGLKYIELEKGDESMPRPRYGQLLSISYTGYVKLPGKESKLQKYDTVTGFVIKHGNGRMIPGLDEGLHTMHVGGKRRLIIPPKLGYVAPGLGPLPVSPLARYQLNNLLDQMVQQRGGNVILDVELRLAMDDEADQGYYDDSSLTPEQFNTLRNNLQESAQRAMNGSGSSS